jgi:hypothetical protein
MQKELKVKRNISAIGEEIGLELGAEFITAFQEKHPNEAGSYQVGRNIIDQILAQPGCAGLRFYNALNEDGQKTLVYVGVDAEGKDLVKSTVILTDGSMATKTRIVADRIQSEPPASGESIWHYLFGL